MILRLCFYYVKIWVLTKNEGRPKAIQNDLKRSKNNVKRPKTKNNQYKNLIDV